MFRSLMGGLYNNYGCTGELFSDSLHVSNYLNLFRHLLTTATFLQLIKAGSNFSSFAMGWMQFRLTNAQQKLIFHLFSCMQFQCHRFRMKSRCRDRLPTYRNDCYLPASLYQVSRNEILRSRTR